VRQLGEIVNLIWPRVPLAKTCSLFTDGNWIETKDQSPDGIRLIQTGNVGNGEFKDRRNKARFISSETFERLKCQEVLPGDCLISRLPDPVGRSCIIPDTSDKMITAVDCSILRFAETKLLSEFFCYYTQSSEYLVAIEHKCTGATRKRISRKNLGQVKIPLPPLPEQKRIVAILDEAFAGIDAAIANTEKNLAHARELFESYLNAVFTQKGDGWKEATLGELGRITSSKRIFKREYTGSGIPFYRTKEVKEKAHGRDITTELFISEERYNEIKQKFGVPQKGDILLTAIGTIGEIFVVDGNDGFYFKDGNVLWLKEFSSANSYFLRYVLMSFVENLKRLSHGAAYNALPIEKLKKHIVYLPSDTQQLKIVSRLDVLQAKTQRLEAIYQEKLSALAELKQSILQKAFAGELTT